MNLKAQMSKNKKMGKILELYHFDITFDICLPAAGGF